MNLKDFSNVELMTRFEKLVRTERKITHLILWHILEIEERRIYAELGYDGMYSYLTQYLGYSDGSAYRRLQSARLLKQVPEMAEKIEAGILNITQLTQVQKSLQECKKMGEVISSEKTAEILEKILYKNTFETQKILALEFNQPIKVSEIVRPQKDESVRLEITLSHEQYQELLQAKSLLSHICFDGSWTELIATLAQIYNKQKLQGRRVVKDQVMPVPNKPLSSTQSVVAAKLCENSVQKTKSKRQYIPANTKRALLQKAQHQCEYQDPHTHKRCSSQFQLQVDHIQPLAQNGSNELSNLRILCRTHNILAAQKFGLGISVTSIVHSDD